MLKLLLFVAVMAAVVYLTVRQLERRGMIPAPRPRPKPDRRPLGPDDDPEFLRDLNRRTRHKKRPEPKPEDPDSPT